MLELCPSTVGPLWRTMLSHQILSIPKVPETDWAATFARAKNEKGPKPGEHVPLFCMKRITTRAPTLKIANWRPPLHFASNGLVISCLGMCWRRFTMLLCAPNSVSNERSCSHRIFFKDKIVRWTRGGGGYNCCSANERGPATPS